MAAFGMVAQNMADNQKRIPRIGLKNYPGTRLVTNQFQGHFANPDGR
jgi:hypothetical protein